MKRLLLVLLVVMFAGCKKKSTSAGHGSDGGRNAAADGDGGGDVEEADVRAGKRTGLGAPDEKPEVATEPLARALVRGEVPWPKVVDASVGVVVLVAGQVAHRCGEELDQSLTDFAAGATGALDADGLVYDIVCDNVGLAVTIAGVTSHAVCTVSSPSGDGLEYDLVFVPDPKLGLRLIGVSTADALTTADALRDQFDEELGRFGARCP